MILLKEKKLNFQTLKLIISTLESLLPTNKSIKWKRKDRLWQKVIYCHQYKVYNFGNKLKNHLYSSVQRDLSLKPQIKIKKLEKRKGLLKNVFSF